MTSNPLSSQTLRLLLAEEHVGRLLIGMQVQRLDGQRQFTVFIATLSRLSEASTQSAPSVLYVLDEDEPPRLLEWREIEHALVPPHQRQNVHLSDNTVLASD